MKILAFSDLHRDLEACAAIVTAARTADLVIGAGDFATRHKGLAETLAALAPVLDRAILVPGNNETEAALRAATTARVLHGEVAEVGGLHIAGIGAAVPPLPPMDWTSFDLSEKQATAMLDRINCADILISHSPPKGVADEIRGLGSIGSHAVRAAIERLKPRLVLCGHVHDCWGMTGRIGGSEVCNLGPGLTWFEA